MSSQKSITALEPKRQRGRQRVSLIMAAATALFVEKGYAATTMTEIAARAETAIGSLYRFFPTKEILADALLARYGERMQSSLEELAGRAADLSPDSLAESLVNLLLALRTERAAAIALIERHGDSPDKRMQLRQTLRASLAGLLTAANPGLDRSQAESKGTLLLHLLKIIPLFAAESEPQREPLIGEIRHLLKLYITDARNGGPART